MGIWSEKSEMLAYMSKTLNVEVTPETVNDLTGDLLDMVETEMGATRF